MTGKEQLVLTFNAGSSTIKYGLFDCASGSPVHIGGGIVDLRREPLMLHMREGAVIDDIALNAPLTDDLHEVIEEVLSCLGEHFPLDGLLAVGHRVVHGGDRFSGPVRIDDENLLAMEALVPLAPLHQPHNLQLVHALRHLRPELVQTASFDTAFHRSQSDLVRHFAIPAELFDDGVKRYGFHGLSYKYIANRLAELEPTLAQGRVVAAHLGSGASLCGMEGGKSRDSSMGFSTIDGLPMATRCGALDPGVILHLLKQRQMPLGDVEDMLYHRSGLLGLSGISADCRDLLESGAPAAHHAVAYFALQVARQTTALATTIGGLDAVIFTAGIGEHQPPVRAAVCRHLAWLGVELDEAANMANATRIHAPSSKVAVLVIPTDEEQVIADEAFSTCRIPAPCLN
ncbi:acetate kinase [Croceicoccus estronivorus]|uniref:acetate/propionate family kinase n=1 Tax=Croceicoccus estronivorus TaxID=1172626 RepID=UPI000836A5E8|nr:acetate/propionate family kinase [Croceicoccus estronivorus]OCC22484.1 acetate kinase [Croceicoccus estronivorus]